MQSPSTKTLSVTVDANALFAAVLGAAQNGKYAVLAVSNEAGRVVLKSGVTAMSWGNEYVVDVAAAPGGAQIAVVCGGVDGAPPALLDGWKNGKKATKFIEAVQGALADPAKFPTTPVASFVTLQDGSIAPWPAP